MCHWCAAAATAAAAPAAASPCTDPQWTILTSWTMDATFYEDEDCSTPSGKTAQYNMSKTMEILEVDSTCVESDFAGSSSNHGYHCIDGNLGVAVYGGSDTTCSLEFTVAAKYDVDACFDSLLGEGMYAVTSCSADSNDARSFLAGEFGCYGWSIAAATIATVLAAVFA